jgi:hypothetical protein
MLWTSRPHLGIVGSVARSRTFRSFSGCHSVAELQRDIHFIRYLFRNASGFIGVLVAAHESTYSILNSYYGSIDRRGLLLGSNYR